MKYSDEFEKPDFTKQTFPKAHAIGEDDIPPHGNAQPRLTGPVLLGNEGPLPVGLSYPNGVNGDFGGYVQRCGEGLPNSFTLDFTNAMKFYGGNVHPHTGLMLFTLALNLRPKVIIETGTYIGYSTMFLAKVCETWGKGIVHTIESNPSEVDSSILKNPFVKLHHGYSQDVLPTILPSLEEVQFAFIDSWKRIALTEFKLIDPFMSPGGIVAFHDTQFLNTGESLYRAIIENYSSSYDIMFFNALVHKADKHKFLGNADDRGLLVIRKKLNIDPFYRVGDYANWQYGARLI